MVSFLEIFEFSLILSYITMVSFIEYPNMVSTAAIKDSLTGMLNIAYTETIIAIS